MTQFNLLYLPAYPPDLNPIEMAFSKLNALLRKAAERTIPGLIRLNKVLGIRFMLSPVAAW
jgi:transposase